MLALSQREAMARSRLRAAERQLQSYRERTRGQIEAMQLALPARLRAGLSSVLEVIAARVVVTELRVREIALNEQAAAARLRAAVAAGTVVEADPREGLVVSTGSGTIRIGEVKPAGRARMEAAAWIRGRGAASGDRFR